jgi:hypothetical protein
MLFSNCFFVRKKHSIDVILGFFFSFNMIMLKIKKYYFNIFLIKKYLYKNIMCYVRKERQMEYTQLIHVKEG